jgi:hypothetical protein
MSTDSDQTQAAPRKFTLGPLGSLNQVTKGLAKTIRAMADGTLDSQVGARLCNGLGIMRACLETQKRLEEGHMAAASPEGGRIKGIVVEYVHVNRRPEELVQARPDLLVDQSEVKANGNGHDQWSAAQVSDIVSRPFEPVAATMHEKMPSLPPTAEHSVPVTERTDGTKPGLSSLRIQEHADWYQDQAYRNYSPAALAAGALDAELRNILRQEVGPERVEVEFERVMKAR